MSSRFRSLSKVALVAAVPALILAIVFMLPPAVASATEHPASATPSHAPAALSALATLHSLIAPAALHSLATPAPPAPPEPPEPPDSRAPRAYHAHHTDDEEDTVERAWLGVTLSEIDEEGARVSDVSDDSPAADAGLEEGDRIIAIEGKKVISSRDVVRAVRAASPGDKVSIKILRDDKEKTLTATLAGRKISDRHRFRFVMPEGDQDFDIDIPDTPGVHEFDYTPGPGHHMRFMTASRTWLGVEPYPMSSELREALKAPSDRGVLVNRVFEDSPAQSAGLKAGDIIIEVAGKPVVKVGDIGEALQEREAGDSVEVKVIRNGSERSIDVKVDDRPGPARYKRGFVVPETMDPEERAAIQKSVHEAMESIHKTLRETHEQLRQDSQRIRGEQDRVREQVQQEMRELRERLRTNTSPVIRARTIHDI